MAAELPLCLLLPVCQVPVLPLAPGEKLIHGVVVAHGSPGPAMGQHPFQMLAMDLNLNSVHQRWALWPCHVVHRVLPVFRWPPSPETIPACALAEPPGFILLCGDVLGLIGAGPDIFTGSDLLRSLLTTDQCRSFTDHSNFPFFCPTPSWLSPGRSTCPIPLHGSLNVPFWEYWTSPYSSHLVDHVPNGWVMFNGNI